MRADSVYRIFRSHYGDLFGGLFGEGNVAEAYAKFHRQHVCNVFCHFFQLPPLEPDDEEGEGVEENEKPEQEVSINVKLETEEEDTGKFAGLGTSNAPIFVDEWNDLYE
jgi:hypothetical protein